ncbi:hypothetical protein JW992_12845 [candidate division KSB1 bacterium]|nr:hypothetical protein [candidate division KSB1 bacterium]
MKELMAKLGEQGGKPNLGSEIVSWIYKPVRSNSVLFSILAVILTAAIFLWPMVRDFLPFLQEIPAIFLYLLVLIGAPLLKRLTNKGKNQEWFLFERGYRVRYLAREGASEEKYGLWHTFKTCTYDAKGIKLIPENSLASAVRIPVQLNVMGIYTIVRERISMAHADELDKASPAPTHAPHRDNRAFDRKSRTRDFRQLKGGWRRPSTNQR